MDQDIISGIQKKELLRSQKLMSSPQHTFKDTLYYILNSWEITLKSKSKLAPRACKLHNKAEDREWEEAR